jgi:hypothetical protein
MMLFEQQQKQKPEQPEQPLSAKKKGKKAAKGSTEELDDEEAAAAEDGAGGDLENYEKKLRIATMPEFVWKEFMLLLKRLRYITFYLSILVMLCARWFVPCTCDGQLTQCLS